MNPESLLNAKNPDLWSSFEALKRAATIARDLAIQTETAIVVMHGDEVIHLSHQMLKALKEKI